MALVLEPYRKQIEALCRRFHVRRLEVFGSALGDDFNPARSDVDFLVEFDQSPDINVFEAYFDLRQQLCELLGLAGGPGDAFGDPVIRMSGPGIEAHRELVDPARYARPSH